LKKCAFWDDFWDDFGHTRGSDVIRHTRFATYWSIQNDETIQNMYMSIIAGMKNIGKNDEKNGQNEKYIMLK